MSETLTDPQKIITNHILWAMGSGLIPIPILDIAAVTAVQLDMIKQLCKHYEVDFSESSGKYFITSLAGSTLAMIGAGIIKIIPGVGSIIGGITQSILSGASTYAVGQVCVRHFSEGGNFEDFNAETFKEYYEEQFKKGKKVAEDMKNKEEKEKKSGKSTVVNEDKKKDPVDRLKDLVKLKEKGILSEEEFQKMKEKLIDKL